MSLFDSLFQRYNPASSNPTGKVDPFTKAMHTQPWSYRSDDGVYVGYNGSVWVYYALPTFPLTWEDPPVQLQFADLLHRTLVDLGATSPLPPGNLRTFAVNRQIHLLAVTWASQLQLPNNYPDALRTYVERAFRDNSANAEILVPTKTLFLGVKLRTGLQASRSESGRLREMVSEGKEMLTRGLGESVPNLRPYDADLETIDMLLSRHGASLPSPAQRDQLQYWFNFGRHGDTVNIERRSYLEVSNHSEIQFSAVMEFESPIQQAPDYRWLEAAMYYPGGPELVSVRAELERPEVTRNRSRRAQRKMIEQIKEEHATGDLAHEEYSETLDLARQYEEFVRNLSEPLITNASIVMASRSVGGQNTYMDHLANRFGIRLKPLENRQLEALQEVLPTSEITVNPFLKELSVSMLSQAGIQAHASLGDRAGLLGGLVDPTMTPLWIDPLAAPRENKPPTGVIIGEPGAGKAQPLDAPVLTPTGERLMGTLAVGDHVIGSDGKPTRIAGVYPQGELPIFTLRFDDGAQAEACGDHLWAVAPTPEAAARRDCVVLSTTQLRDRLEAQAWYVPVVAPVEHPSRDLPVHPALLGQLLRAAARDEARPLCEDLVDAGVGDDLAVPDSYLTADTDQRRELLSTLLGSCRPGPAVPVPTTLHPSVVALVRSLGGIARPAGSDSMDVHLPPHPRQAVPGSPVARELVSIETAGVKSAQCIKVEAGDQLYVTSDYVVTHNTFLLQHLAVQSVHAGLPVVFINPKGYPRETTSLEASADLVGGRTIRLTDLRQQPGMLDPFAYADPSDAAQMAYRYIVSVLHFGGDESKQLTLQNGLRLAADSGARSTGEALGYVEDEAIRNLVEQQRRDPLFNLAISDSPPEPLSSGGALTLIEFDQPLETPSPKKNPANYTKEERLAVATMRLVTRAALYMLTRRGQGGVLIVDEAWQMLNQPETEEDLERMSRLGRSQNILPLLATQKISDVLERGLEQYITRVFLMQMRDEDEARAGLKICGLEPTAERVQRLRTLGPPQQSDTNEAVPPKWAEMIHRDLRDRHALVWVGPVPRDAAAAFTTNPEDRQRAVREAAEQDAQMAASEAAGADYPPS